MTVAACRVTVTDMSTQTDFSSWRPTDTLAHRLVLLRHELDLSQREAAIRTGISFGVWQGMESGRGTRGVDKAVVKIAAALGVDRDWLMWGGQLADPDGPGSRRPSVTNETNDGSTTRQYLAENPDFWAAA